MDEITEAEFERAKLIYHFDKCFGGIIPLTTGVKWAKDKFGVRGIAVNRDHIVALADAGDADAGGNRMPLVTASHVQIDGRQMVAAIQFLRAMYGKSPDINVFVAPERNYPILVASEGRYGVLIAPRILNE